MYGFVASTVGSFAIAYVVLHGELLCPLGVFGGSESEGSNSRKTYSPYGLRKLAILGLLGSSLTLGGLRDTPDQNALSPPPLFGLPLASCLSSFGLSRDLLSSLFALGLLADLLSSFFGRTLDLLWGLGRLCADSLDSFFGRILDLLFFSGLLAARDGSLPLRGGVGDL